jgi:hypothetical protein
MAIRAASRCKGPELKVDGELADQGSALPTMLLSQGFDSV